MVWHSAPTLTPSHPGRLGEELDAGLRDAEAAVQQLIRQPPRVRALRTRLLAPLPSPPRSPHPRPQAHPALRAHVQVMLASAAAAEPVDRMSFLPPCDAELFSTSEQVWEALETGVWEEAPSSAATLRPSDEAMAGDPVLAAAAARVAAALQELECV